MIDSAIPICLTALAIAMAGCNDAGGMNVTGDAGDGGMGGTMAATESRDGGQQQMIDGQMIVVPDSGTTVTTPDAQSGDKAEDAIPADSSPPQNMPDPMAVVKRLKAIPPGVIFMVDGSPTNTSFYISAKAAGIYKNCQINGLRPLFMATSRPNEPWYNVPIMTVDSYIVPVTPLLEKEVARLGLSKALVRYNVPGMPGISATITPMSIEDWMNANSANIEQAIESTMYDPTRCK